MLAVVKCGVLFEVRTEFLNVMCTSFGFKGLKLSVTWVKGLPNTAITNQHAAYRPR
jgi:hypothetical protein